MMASLEAETWLRLIAWLVIVLAIYFGYGARHSRRHLATHGAE